MQIEIVEKYDKHIACDAVVLCSVIRNKKPHIFSQIKAFAQEFSAPIEQKDFLGKEGEISLVYLPKAKEKRGILLGFGDEEKVDLHKIRNAFGNLTFFCRKKQLKNFLVVLPKLSSMQVEESFKAALEGIFFTNYNFDKKTKREEEIPLISKVSFFGIEAREKIQHLIAETKQVFLGVDLARNLINENADVVTPEALAKVAQELSKSLPHLKTKVLTKKELVKEKMALLLAVGQGASYDPRLIILEYRGDPQSKECTAVVGKGITFDTGGLNLKPTGSIETMRSDMSGAAIVLGTMKIIAELKLKINVVGVIASAENAIGPKSYKPGDVFVGKSGISVEITNTDAEGRLVLADAMAYVKEHIKPDRIIDFATLTGAIEIALGNVRAGLFTTDRTLLELFQKAGEKTGEKVWPMPLDSEYKELLKSEIADIKNSSSKRKAGATTGALFIKEFVGDTPWAHLDIAGVAFLEKKFFHSSQATGYGVRLLLEVLYGI